MEDKAGKDGVATFEVDWIPFRADTLRRRIKALFWVIEVG
jgi:hypothetical protein